MRHGGVGRETRDVLHQIGPILTAVGRDLQVPIVCSSPNLTFLNRRLRNGYDRPVILGGRVFDRDWSTRVFQFFRIVGGEIRTDLFPRLTEVGRFENNVSGEKDSCLVVWR